MRSYNTIRNTIYTLSFQVIVLLIGFIVPRYIILTYGSEVNGLTSNINQLLSTINLLQGGIVGASIFEMYKPIAEKNYGIVSEIFYSADRHFKKLSSIFFLLTLLIIPYIIFGKNMTLSPISVIISVIILGMSSTITFRYFCKYDVVFSAFQQKYQLVIAMALNNLTYYFLLGIVIFLKLPYVFMYLALLVGTCIQLTYIRIRFTRDFENTIITPVDNPNYKIKNQYKLFGNQVIQNLINTLPTIIVTTFWGLKYASVIYVYTLVVNVFRMIFTTLQNAIAASFGDLVAHGDEKRTIEIFNVITYLFTGLGFILYSTTAILMISFVKLYSAGARGVGYVYSDLATIICVYMMVYTSFMLFELLINTFGLYGKVLRMNIILFIISTIISVIFAIYDFQYVYIGGIIYYLGGNLYRFYLLKFREKLSINFSICIKTVGFPLYILVLSYLSNKYTTTITWPRFLILGILLVSIFGVIFIVYSFLLEKENMCYLYNKFLKGKQ